MSINKRISSKPNGGGGATEATADGIDDYDDKYTLSVKLKRNRHTNRQDTK